MLKSVLQWFLYSSHETTKISLSLKAGIPLLIFLGMDKYITPDQAETVIDSAMIILTSVGTIVTAVVTAFGVTRKVTLTTLGALKRQG